MMDQLCTYCQVPLTIKTPRIQCSDCPTSRLVTLCLECFSSGVEAGAHRATHDYQVVNENSLRIIGGRNNWTSGEIEQLLEAIDLFNIGNWLDISDHVATKSSSECLNFYTNYFMNGNIGRTSSCGQAQKLLANDHTDGPKESTPLQPLQEISVQDQQDVGYMVLRDDFDQEYDADAETDMIHLEMNMDDDDDADIAYKLFRAECYRHRLKERERRKNISKEYGILFEATSIGTKKALLARKKLTKEERELKEKLKLFARFHGNSDHEKLFQGLLKHRRLKIQLKDLQRYRKNGIKKLTDCEDFESNLLMRDKKKDAVKMNSNSSSSKRDRDGNIIETKVQNSSKPSPLTLLRPGELKLCKSISLDPTSYMAVKLCILSDVHHRKSGIHTKLRFPPDMDKPKRKRMIDFFASNKWITVANNQPNEVKVL